MLPSIAEATPLVLLEAMSKGLPWIASETCGSASELAGGVIVGAGGLCGGDHPAPRRTRARGPSSVAPGDARYVAEYSWDAVAPRYLAALDDPVWERSAEPASASSGSGVRSQHDGRAAQLLDDRGAAGRRSAPRRCRPGRSSDSGSGVSESSSVDVAVAREIVLDQRDHLVERARGRAAIWTRPTRLRGRRAACGCRACSRRPPRPSAPARRRPRRGTPSAGGRQREQRRGTARAPTSLRGVEQQRLEGDERRPGASTATPGRARRARCDVRLAARRIEIRCSRNSGCHAGGNAGSRNARADRRDQLGRERAGAAGARASSFASCSRYRTAGLGDVDAAYPQRESQPHHPVAAEREPRVEAADGAKRGGLGEDCRHRPRVFQGAIRGNRSGGSNTTSVARRARRRTCAPGARPASSRLTTGRAHEPAPVRRAAASFVAMLPRQHHVIGSPGNEPRRADVSASARFIESKKCRPGGVRGHAHAGIVAVALVHLEAAVGRAVVVDPQLERDVLLREHALDRLGRGTRRRP